MTRSGLLFLCVSLASTPARALPTGGVFAGAVRASGSSAYWNPAALVTEPDGWLGMVEVGCLFVHVGYERAGIDPRTTAPYPKVTFNTPVPDLAFTLAAPSPWPWLRFAAGGMSPVSQGATWADEGPQRYFSARSILGTYAVVGGVVVQPLPKLSFAALGGPLYGALEVNNSLDFGAIANQKLGSDFFTLEDPTLEGRSHAAAAGWSVLSVFGVWAEPLDNLTLGASLTLARGITMQGNLHTSTSEALQRALPNFELAPSAHVTVRYPMPWTLNLEGEWVLGQTRLSLLGQYTRKSVQKTILASVTEAHPQFIEGRTVSFKDAHDDWLVGGRVARPWNDDWEWSARLDFDPRYVPDEAVSPGNLDFTNIFAALGARYRVSEQMRLSVSYAFVAFWPFTVKNSLYNPRAPRESGLALPSANGHYWGQAHVLTVGFDYVATAAEPSTSPPP